MRAAAALALGVLLCAACAPPPTTPETLFIAHALQTGAPAVATSGAGVAFAWAGFDAVNVHQDARLLRSGTLSEAVVLPLPPAHPFDQRLIAGADGRLHLFWLDAAQDGQGNRLYSAILGPDLGVQRGPIALSNEPTYRYSAIADGQGGALAVWSAGAAAEPTLTAGRVDLLGRPLPPELLTVRGQFPALTSSGASGVHLFWLAEGQLWRMALGDSPGGAAVAVSASVGLWPGDALDSLWAAPCGEMLCAGWNITRADGSAESWLSAGRAAADQWPPPRRIEGLAWLTPGTASAAGEAGLTAAAQTPEGLSLVRILNGTAGNPELAVRGVEIRGALALLQTPGGWLLSWADSGPQAAQLYAVQMPP